jgi:hypothetical protein
MTETRRHGRRLHPAVVAAVCAGMLVLLFVGGTLMLRGSDTTTFDTTGERQHTADVCGIPVQRLQNEQVDDEAVSWTYRGVDGLQHVASLSYVGRGISCG